MALNPSNSSNLEQLALKGLKRIVSPRSQAYWCGMSIEQRTRKQMSVRLFQANSLLVEFAITLGGMSCPALAQFLHRMFALSTQKYNDRCILRKVQSIDSIWRHIEHAVTSLSTTHKTHFFQILQHRLNKHPMSCDGRLPATCLFMLTFFSGRF